MYSNHGFVLLPGEGFGVMLTPTLARGLVTLASAGERGATLNKIERQCRASASSVIARLRASGASIATIRATYTIRGVVHIKGATRYQYLAWDPEAPNIYPCCFAKVEEWLL